MLHYVVLSSVIEHIRAAVNSSEFCAPYSNNKWWLDWGGWDVFSNISFISSIFAICIMGYVHHCFFLYFFVFFFFFQNSEIVLYCKPLFSSIPRTLLEHFGNIRHYNGKLSQSQFQLCCPRVLDQWLNSKPAKELVNIYMVHFVKLA